MTPTPISRAPRFLSKSKLMSGAQCAKRLWLEVHAPERAVVSDETQRAFDVGHEVGAVARGLWPGGVLIGHDQDLSSALRETTERLSAPGAVTIFEATLRANGVLVRNDILERGTAGDIRLVEVKASTSVKPQYIQDGAIQAWVLRGAGFAPARVELGTINNQFVYPGGGDYRGLIALTDITAEVEAVLPGVPGLVAELRTALAGAEPAIGIGPHCNKPYACPFIGYCSGAEPEVPPAGEAVLRPAAAATLRALDWPRYYFDFETVSFAVPIWPGTRPYQALPFQWSCHVEQAGGHVGHQEFLADGSGDPRRECAERLIAALGSQGPVLVYTNYERGVLNGLAEAFPDLAPALEAIIARLFDLHPVTKANYSHPAMRGSWSLKAVLPTIAPDLDYTALDHVTHGAEAEVAFRQLLRPDLPDDERQKLRQALYDYCRMDTAGLVRLVRFLEGSA